MQIKFRRSISVGDVLLDAQVYARIENILMRAAGVPDAKRVVTKTFPPVAAEAGEGKEVVSSSADPWGTAVRKDD